MEEQPLRTTTQLMASILIYLFASHMLEHMLIYLVGYKIHHLLTCRSWK